MYIPKNLKVPKHLKLVTLQGKGRAILAARNIKKGKVICNLQFDSIKESSKASDHSIQIEDDKFLDSKYYFVHDFINHSCNPNAVIDFKNFNFIALRNIFKGEEIVSNYLTTEYDLVKDKLDFDCMCGYKRCLKRIRGFKFLTKAQKIKLKPLLSPFLKRKLE
jgi:hypothetical protein